ncbi:MAG: beta-ketoacyl-ACP synthase II [Verrucomicrobiota bacterium]|nr:beta-ketoacyl-ACP synthase II [Verrucomicrobiota bacterium]
MAEQKHKPTIVVTGMGVVTSLGTEVDTFWANLLAGNNGISKLTRFDTTDYPCRIGAEIKDFDPAKWMEPKEVRRNDRYTHYAYAAARIAVQDAALDVTKVDKTRFGVIVGSGIGGMETIETQAKRLFESGPRKVSPFMIPMLISNIASGVIAIEFGAMGPNYGIVSACATGSHSLYDCLRIMRSGETDVMIAGGSEAAITQLGFAGFCSMKAMATAFNDDPTRSSRPFDAKRDGFVMGEGAGILVLETLEHAKARGARIYAELAGAAATCDAYHITQPDLEGRGLSLCMRNALKDADITPEQVDYINAHGTSTPYNDKTETASIKAVFGQSAYKVKISSTKSMTGHLLGAAGGIEAVTAIKAIQTGEIPPTMNYEVPDPECDLNYTPNAKTTADVKIAISNNLGFGGHNACVVFRAI